ncbi:MAG: AtpZ/AtpI family protein [Anaerolineae bacterium]|nr:AtpZ/AtpI family protein [Anaerolineae bacterium]
MSKKDETNTWGFLLREGLSAMSLGWDLALPIFGGVLLGYYVDRWLGTRYIFTIGLLMGGIGIGFYNIGRFIHRVAQRDQALTEAKKEEEDELQ